ncbi:methylated-DNA--[protein]-cysteine S-methyltransferase [Sandarakinorhabdus sp.]|uniref:methylated-DNA--[protein]-cysteine S-methyltransferase n=1 Tax=Sandarakinorhabdus sp. TaxID=1916663 RepID=UPI003F6FD9CD
MHIFSRIPSPLGHLLAVTAPDGTLHALDFADYEPRLRTLFARHHPHAALTPGEAPPALTTALGRYFAGETRVLGTIRVASFGSAFQQRVWSALRQIPPGETRSYGALAATIGSPGASRAVGLANGANPIAIVVPCHRVIGASGTLTGYAGGVTRKAWLLTHEGALAGAP